MALKARVLYDFHSENPGEISITENELVTLFNEEELEGWLEGENSRGEAGLFPASYVEIIRDHITSSTNNNNGISSPQTKALTPTHTSYTSSDTQSPRGLGAGSSGSGGGSFHASQGSDDDWDDDWDDASPAADAGKQGLGRSPAMYPVTTSLPGRRESSQQQQQQAKGSATVGRNLNRFSTFVKSGGEAFLLGEASAFVKDGDRICVAMGKHGPEWQEDPYPFLCTIDDPTKQTKFKGMKSYMSYGLTPTHTNVQVNRRYRGCLPCPLPPPFLSSPGFSKRRPISSPNPPGPHTLKNTRYCGFSCGRNCSHKMSKTELTVAVCPLEFSGISPFPF